MQRTFLFYTCYFLDFDIKLSSIIDPDELLSLLFTF